MDLSHKQPSVIYNMIKLKLIRTNLLNVFERREECEGWRRDNVWRCHNEKLM